MSRAIKIYHVDYMPREFEMQIKIGSLQNTILKEVYTNSKS